MDQLVKIETEKCKICYACVRACPVKAIKISAEGGFPEILPERCIDCGSCIDTCSPKAIVYRSSVNEVINLLKNYQKTVAIVSPAISGEFDDISDVRKLIAMIKALGFKYVNDVSFGVDLVARQYEDLFNNFKGKYYITSHCPVVVTFVEKFHPNLIDNLTPIVSPLIATAKVVRKKYGNDVKIVYLSPNIGPKKEIERYTDDGKVDCVITFSELRGLFKSFDINESALEYIDFDGPIGYKGMLFPIENGILQAGGISEDLLEGNIVTISGKKRMLIAVKEFEEQLDLIKKHFNLIYEDTLTNCGTGKKHQKHTVQALVVNYARKRIKLLDKEQWTKELDSCQDINLGCTFKTDDQRLPIPSESKIIEILKSVNMTNENIQHDCTSCGYASCREFAISVSQGLTTTHMCTTFALRNKQNYIHTLRKTNEELAKTQDALKQSESVSKLEHDKAKEANEIFTTMISKLRSGVVIIDNKLKIIHSNQKFIDMLGKEAQDINEVVPGLTGADIKSLLPFAFQNLILYVLSNDDPILNRDIPTGDNVFNVSVFTIKKNKVAGAVIRDLTMPEIQKEEFINKLNEVVDKNLSMVQQIGYILGEGASQSEEMLRSVIESFQSGKKNNS